jgi:hypothetical protein
MLSGRVRNALYKVAAIKSKSARLQTTECLFVVLAATLTRSEDNRVCRSHRASRKRDLDRGTLALGRG